MLRTFAGLVCAFVIFASVLLADEVKGKFKKYEKGTITVTVGDKDVEYKYGKDAKVFDGDTELLTGKDRGKFLKDLTDKASVTITYEKDGDKITVKEIKVKK